MSGIVRVEDLDAAIEKYKRDGYRLDMIFPADNPREALLSIPPALAGGSVSAVRLVLSRVKENPAATADSTDTHADAWIRGRAGMEYRDLVPHRVGGKVIASHIRLVEDGPVADYVHYHKVEFQMIYCLKGRIKVVYEDQGDPFWLETGDSVVQPPEIRHRVLYAQGGAEVLEITMPSEHETWIDHDIELPNVTVNRERLFGGQKFVVTKAS